MRVRGRQCRVVTPTLDPAEPESRGWRSRGCRARAEPGLELWERPAHHLSPAPQKCLLTAGNCDILGPGFLRAQSHPGLSGPCRRRSQPRWGGGRSEGLSAWPSRCHLPKPSPASVGPPQKGPQPRVVRRLLRSLGRGRGLRVGSSMGLGGTTLQSSWVEASPPTLRPAA